MKKGVLREMEENKAVQGAEVKEIKVEFSDEAKCEKQCNDTDGSSSKKEKFKKNWKKWLFAVVCIVVAISVGAGFITSRSPKAIAKRFAIANYNNLEKCANALIYDYKAMRLLDYDNDEEKFFEEMEEVYEVNISSWKDYFKAADKSAAETREDIYGKHRITAEVTKTRDISTKKLLRDQEKYLMELESDLHFDRDQIEDAKLITVKVKIKGEDDIDRVNETIYMVKIGGRWGVLKAVRN